MPERALIRVESDKQSNLLVMFSTLWGYTVLAIELLPFIILILSAN